MSSTVENALGADEQPIDESVSGCSILPNEPDTPSPETNNNQLSSEPTPELQPAPCSSPDFQTFSSSDEQPNEGTLHEFYRDKTILLTGATGFIGKAILWKLLQAYGEDLKCVYILVRSGSQHKKKRPGKPMDRIRNEILSNKAFVALRRKMGVKVFDTLVKQKIIGVAGDMISPDLSIASEDRELLTRTVNIVVHCAATGDYNERLDLALETNTLGTLRLLDLAEKCQHMQAFLFLSPGYTDFSKLEGTVQERVYPMELGDPEELLRHIVGNELQDIPRTTQRILQYYPNTYCFTKALTEHSILRRVEYNRQEEKKEDGKKQWPIAIIRATQVGAALKEPLPGWLDGVTGVNGAIMLMGQGYQVVSPEVGSLSVDIVPVDYLARVVTSCAAVIRPPGTDFILPLMPRGPATVHVDDGKSNIFPTIYQVSGEGLHGKGTSIWNDIYDAVRLYWTTNTESVLPSLQEYFPINKGFKTRFFKGTLPQYLASSEISAPLDNKTIELASNSIKSFLPFLCQPCHFADRNLKSLCRWLQDADPSYSFKDLDWHTYLVNYAFGTHVYFSELSYGVRNITIPGGWECALYRPSLLDKQIESVVYSSYDIEKRTERMLLKLIATLKTPGRDILSKKQIEEWHSDFDSCLDDWCHDDSQMLSKRQVDLGIWSKKMDDESIKVDVLNDERVASCIRQILSSSSSTPKKTIVGEAIKILQRIRERTRAPYVWFAGAFLGSLFRRLFSSIRLKKLDLEKLKERLQGKNVVYVPASKTIVDQLVIWYIALRYQLPVPAIICNEAFANLGPVSDIFRIAGACFIRRDPDTRSPLNTAVTAAYTKVLLRKHGAITILIEKARSRTGRLQTGFDDELLSMVIEASVNDDNKPTNMLSPVPLNKAHKETVFVPINITYEKIPELDMLVQQSLGQTVRMPQTSPADDSQNYLTSDAWSSSRTYIPSNMDGPKDITLSRVCIGVGEVLNINQISQMISFIKASDGIIPKEEAQVKSTIERVLRESHLTSTVVSSIALVASTVLYGRLMGGLSIGAICKHVEWLRGELLTKHATVDWHDGEDVGMLVAHALRSQNIRANVIIEGKLAKEQSNVLAIEHTENIMTLSYLASPLIELFFPEALFAAVYLSAGPHTMARSEWLRRFEFLEQLLTNEFIHPWKTKEKFSQLVDQFTAKGMLAKDGSDQYRKNKTAADDDYELIYLLSSFIYPTLDAYWITSCSLSVLGELPFIPRKIVPTLSQWIAAHLISGRQTKYREVLSTESTQRALKTFLAIGLVDCVHLKSKLSAESQILLLELDVKDSEDLVVIPKNEQRKKQETTERLEQPKDQSTDEMTAMATNDIASLCHEIELYRVGANLLQSDIHRQNAQVFEKCRNQIRSILRVDKSFASQQGMCLDRDEEQMIQLVYALKAASSTDTSSAELKKEGGRNHPRRISEAYNLKSY